MDERDQQRKIRHRLSVLRHAEEVTGSVAATGASKSRGAPGIGLIPSRRSLTWMSGSFHR